MKNNMVYTIVWEIKRSGRVRDFCTLDKQEYEEVLKNIINNNRYELLEHYELELVK